MKANKLVLAWKSIKAFAKRNAFSCACFLLALVVLVTGSVSYAKYVNGNSQDGSASAGSFSASATIDSVTALSFTNTAFWGESDSGEENDVAMNALRSINFSVNNFKGTGSDQVVSSVRTKYVLSFSAPQNFMEQLALQVLNEQGTAQLPQIVVADLIKAVGTGNSGTYNTADSVDYNSATFNDLTFTVTKSGSNYTATSGTTTVTLEAFTKQVEQSLDFRMWDTSKLTSEDHKTLESEGGELLPSLTATYSQNVNYYRITISTGAFVLPAGTPTTVKHIVQLAPINVLTDEHIGGTFVTLQKDGENITGFAPITEIYGDTSAPQFTLMRVSESSTGTFYTNDTFTTTDATQTAETESPHVLTGTPVTYTANGVYTSSSKTTEQVNETTNGGTYTVTITTESAKNAWSDWEVTGTAPTVSSPTESGGTYIGQTQRVGTSTTPFYIHLMPAERTCTSTVEEIEITKEYSARTTTDRTKDVTERKTVTEVTKNENGTTETIKMQVVRTTKTTDIGKETVTKTTTTTTTFTRTYTETGKMYIAYFISSGATTGNLTVYPDSDLDPTSLEDSIGAHFDSVLVRNADMENAGCLINEQDELITVSRNGTQCNVKINSSGQYVYADDDIVIPDQSSVPAVKTIKSQKTVHDVTAQTTDGTKTTLAPVVNSITHTDQEFSETKTETEYIQRTITRNYTFTEVALTKVTWCQRDSNGKPEYINNVLQTEDFTLSNKLNLYDAAGIQKLYLAQCYSKTYPFFVDVQFEQIQ